MIIVNILKFYAIFSNDTLCNVDMSGCVYGIYS